MKACDMRSVTIMKRMTRINASQELHDKAPGDIRVAIHSLYSTFDFISQRRINDLSQDKRTTTTRGHYFGGTSYLCGLCFMLARVEKLRLTLFFAGLHTRPQFYFCFPSYLFWPLSQKEA